MEESFHTLPSVLREDEGSVGGVIELTGLTSEGGRTLVETPKRERGRVRREERGYIPPSYRGMCGVM